MAPPWWGQCQNPACWCHSLGAGAGPLENHCGRRWQGTLREPFPPFSWSSPCTCLGGRLLEPQQLTRRGREATCCARYWGSVRAEGHQLCYLNSTISFDAKYSFKCWLKASYVFARYQAMRKLNDTSASAGLMKDWFRNVDNGPLNLWQYKVTKRI